MSTCLVKNRNIKETRGRKVNTGPTCVLRPTYMGKEVKVEAQDIEEQYKVSFKVWESSVPLRGGCFGGRELTPEDGDELCWLTQC